MGDERTDEREAGLRCVADGLLAPATGLLMHSDRGSQNASDDYRKLLKQYHMTQSMSRKGNCWDNAPIESFFKTLKVERTYRLRYTSRDQARLDIVNWIEGFYNEKRLHSAIDYTRGLRARPESCMSLMYVESRQGQTQENLSISLAIWARFPNPKRTGSVGQEGIPHEKQNDPQAKVTCPQGKPEGAVTGRRDFLRTHSTGEDGEPQGSRKGRPRYPLEGRGSRGT